ncbi:MAG: FMN-binding protein [Chloroflexi bacterium]|nr:FMN-binding protein [Chloroflexota bacterium]
MHKSIPALITTAATIIPAGSALAATQPVAKPTTTTHAATTRTYKGPSVDMRWGPVQVTIIVKGKRITDVRTVAPTERSRSAYINNIAVPMLRSEVLKAQSAKIYGISGATMTSDAFYQSLVPALKAAHI